MLKCKNCGNPLPSDGVVCKFCGVAMDASQIIERNKYKDKEDKRIMLLSEKYGHEKTLEYNNRSENKLLGVVIIVVVLIILITLTILINI